MNRALIIGAGGQDGRLLFERLERDGCTILGIGRTGAPRGSGSLDPRQYPMNVLDQSSVAQTIAGYSPDAVFYLAGHHHSAEDRLPPNDLELYIRSHDVHVLGLLHVLEAVRRQAPRTRIFYAASSHCFGEPPAKVQDEATPLRPRGVYGITKTTGVHLCRRYRALHGVAAAVGFLYNHESPLRSRNFLSMKIAVGAVEISRGRRDKLILGDLSARVDWGYAVDCVDAMIRILNLTIADDFVIATGQSHSVEEFVTIAFSRLKLDWRRHVEVDPSVIAKREAEVELIGNSEKLRALTDWSPSVTFQQMVELLVDTEVKRQCSMEAAR
jgi:GDPmannose 4,6-dehydratase